MTRISGLAILLVWTLISTSANASDGLSEHTLVHEGIERQYLRYVPPAAHQIGTPKQLIILLHGGGGTGRSMMRSTGFNRLAAREGFVGLYPSGVNRHWNDGRPQYQGVDDVGFILAAIQETMAEIQFLDETQIFLAGMSNGGHMIQRLICEQAARFAGAAIVTAQLTPELIKSCRPSKPLGILYINGTEDPLMPFDGGPIAPQWGSRGTVTSTAETLDFWRMHNTCASFPKVTQLPDLDATDGTLTERLDWPDCAPGAPLRLYRINGGGHAWPRKKQYLPERVIGRTSKDIDANDLIIDFFKSLDRAGKN
ncbi:alpha/beta hydrolase family esterase [Sneathiella limimaris]|uniref:alpha/beta hydrolase family esterase n=1 Tax=Sneathiella limimaris TaxID=1964213 RepID=UPI001469A9CC|nr:PHB depolymerase family esterase [Sneathiella limimaris]